jgi:hypothetical protein
VDEAAVGVDYAAARALLLERGMPRTEIASFLARSVLTASDTATVLGVKDARTARDTLRRWGVAPIGRGPGRSGENCYPAELVWLHHQTRPGRAWRRNRISSPSTSRKYTMQSVQAPSAPAWYADQDELVGFAHVLVEAVPPPDPHAVIDLFEKPWKWDREYRVWTDAGRPRAEGDPGWTALLGALHASDPCSAVVVLTPEHAASAAEEQQIPKEWVNGEQPRAIAAILYVIVDTEDAVEPVVQLCKDTFAEREDFTLRGFSIDDRGDGTAFWVIGAPASEFIDEVDEAIAAVDHGNWQTHRG